LGPFFLTLYFYKEFFRHETELIRKIYRVILVLQGVFPVVAFTLHFTDIMHLPEVLTVCHVLLLTNVVTVLVVLIRRVLRKDNTHRYMVFGLIILILLSIADMVRFNLYIRLMREKMQGYVSYLLVGFFLFLIAMIIDFFVNQRKRLYKAAHAEAMAKLALIDMMTNLANRRGCENAFDAIRKNNKIFGIICIDINFLKLTNDKYGHQEGDKLLVDFAGLLTSACEGMECTVGRMGGDEFTVIVPEADNEKLESIIETLNAKRDEINVSRTPMPISFAYGFCLSDDAELEGHTGTGDIVELVYQIADERMYQNKVAMKARREDVSDGV
jgi:diguanylate cyclase (GGDEF)-like protein